MKRKSFRRILSAALTLCMVLALLPTSAFAATTVTPSPNTGNSSVDSLDVEYFSSTLYNWDESAANAATATADYSSSITSGVLSTASTGTLWTITAVDGVENGYTVSTTIDGTEWYITWGGVNSADAELTTTATTILITDTSANDASGAGYISLAVTSGSYVYLNYYSSSQGFGGWSSGAGSDDGSRFTLYASDDTDTALTTSSITSGSQYYIKSARANAYLTGTTSTSEGYEGKGFYFTASDSKGDSVPSFSQWVTGAGYDQNYMIYSGLAASNLSDTTNAPFNDDTVNAANLFATDGSNTSYTSVYTNVQVPFVYDSETGYYTLDSDSYGVYFANGNASSGATMSIADLPMGYYAYAGSYYYKCGYAPFNTPSSSYDTTRQYEQADGTQVNAYAIQESMVYGFGMVTSVDFQMTDDGQIDGEDIVFEFSGDDDVWVYIDDQLVLDIGGTHDAITGTINFRTGDVTLTAENYSNIGDKATGTVYNTNTMSQTNLYTALNTTLTGFASEGTHTMTIYYMDRGQGRTNCLIRFNLPQEDSLSVTKDIASTYTDGDEIDSDILTNLGNIDFSFTLYNGNDTVKSANYSLYDADGNFVQTGSTDSNGQFTLKNGYTAVFNDIDLNNEGTSYKVVENLSSTRWSTTCSYTAYINSVTTDSGTIEGTEAKVTVSQTTGIGTDTSADYIHYTFTNQYVKGADPDVDVYDETIVLDYGLPVQVDVISNDTLTLYGKSIGSEYDPKVTYTLVNDNENEVGSYEGTYGTATIDENGKVTYTLTEDFCGIETVKYKISVTVTLETATGAKKTKSNSATGTLTIIPATSVYYEENFSATYGTDNDGNLTMSSNFVSIDTNSAVFANVSDDKTYNTYQETGLVGTTTDSTYGTDKIYLDNLGDSYGTSLKVDTTEGAAQYTYTFTGTGTTIYGRVSDDTGYIKVSIYKLNDNGNRIVEETGTYEGSDEKYTIYETADEEVIDTADLISDEEYILGQELYNIPIYQYTALDYGTYEVRVYVYKAGTTTSTGDGAGNEFYLDGIRVHNPMGTSTADTGDDYTTAASAYATDGEANVSVVNIHDKITGDDEAGLTSGIYTLTDIDGSIMTVVSSEDETDDTGNAYVDVGPNQEFYLKGGGYTMTFALVNWSSTSYKLYLGLKAPTGDATSVTFNTYVLDEETETSSEMGTINVNNSADCYYDISNYVDVKQIEMGEDEDGNPEYLTVGFVTITSSSDKLVALTNIKVTGVDAFELDYATDENYDDEGDGTDAVNTIYVANSALAASLLIEDDEEEVQAFEPSSIKLSCSYASLTKKATVTVSTSTDVAYVTINGTKVTGTSVAGGMLKFSKSFTKVTKGTTYEVIAYDSNGVASETYTVTAK